MSRSNRVLYHCLLPIAAGLLTTAVDPTPDLEPWTLGFGTIYDTAAMETSSPLAAWGTFFFLVGSSAAALTGLQFVVIALIADSPRRATTREIAAFGTPTILHFCAVLLVSAILNAPWQGLSRVSFALGVCGVLGAVYGILVIRRTGGQTTYQPVWEDWLWHALLPPIAYMLFLVAAFTLTRYSRQTLFVIAGAALLLLFVGIHNAWDAVTYITIDQGKTTELAEAPEKLQPEESEPDEPRMSQGTQR